LVDTLAELTDSIRNGRSALKHLASNRIHNVKQLKEHLFVESLFPLILDKGTCVLLFIRVFRSRCLRLLTILVSFFLVALIRLLQVLDSKETRVDALALDSKQVVQTAACLRTLRKLGEILN